MHVTTNDILQVKSFSVHRLVTWFTWLNLFVRSKHQKKSSRKDFQLTWPNSSLSLLVSNPSKMVCDIISKYNQLDLHALKAAQATFKSIKAVVPLLDRILVQRFKPETVRSFPYTSLMVIKEQTPSFYYILFRKLPRVSSCPHLPRLAPYQRQPLLP